MSALRQAIRPRRVIVNGKFLSADATGVHRVAEELLLGMHRILARDPELARRLELSLWVPRNGEEKARQLGVPYRVIGPLTGIPWEQITLPSLARDRTVLSLCNVGPMLLRNAVTMFHDAQVRSSPGSYGLGFRAWYRLHQPVAGRRHRRILTVSRFSRDQIDHYRVAPAGRVDVVHNGVDHMLRLTADTSVIDRLQLQRGRYVVALANTQAHKNVGLLLRAFQDPRLAQTKLVLFGSAQAPAFAAMGHPVDGPVVFAGRVTDAQLRGLYEHALCMAFPSLTEGFGLPPLEAMILGCPAVVAPCGALPEVCSEAAIYADPMDVTAWADSIVKLAADPAWRVEKQVQSREWASRMTWDAAARKLVDVLMVT